MTKESDGLKNKNKIWRKTLIHPKFQYTMIGFNLVLSMIAIVIFYIENIYVFSKFTDPSVLPIDAVIQEFVNDERRTVTIIFLMTSFIVLISMVVGGLILSNRVAGPIYRLQKHMERFLEGTETNPLKFRKDDFFPELAESANKIMNRIKELQK